MFAISLSSKNFQRNNIYLFHHGQIIIDELKMIALSSVPVGLGPSAARRSELWFTLAQTLV